MTSHAFLALLCLGCSHHVPPPAGPGAAPMVCPPDDQSDIAPTPTRADLDVLRRADALLSAPSAWNHFGDRDCDATARSWNLYCVLHRASLDVMGAACHRSAAMQEVRWVVDDRTRGVDLAHRLMDYNNLPTTTFADIKGVLAEAIQRLSGKLHAS